MSALKICPTCGTEYPANERFCQRDGTALRSQDGGTDLVGSIIAERYHVLKKLGEGGMGQVYLAEHVKMGRKSAVKVMNPGMVHDADAIARFNREAANASRINHPHVAGIYDFGETPEGLIYLAMEFIEGESLTAVVDANGALPALRAADITRQAAEGLSVAHDMGIVHRDLKPDNIMIARNRDGSDCVKVVDFGIAKAADSASQKVTRTGMVVGTPEYMSPEQLAGDKLDSRSDIYSLGLVAFNMLTGKLPFPSETAQESMIMRLTDKPKRLAEMRAMSWPDDVQAVMDKVLERDAGLRYQSATAFGRDLFAAIERMPRDALTTDGTMVMETPAIGVPVTRFDASAAGARAGARAVARAVAPAGAPTAAIPAAAAPARKNRTAILAGGVAAAVAAVVAVMMALKGGSPTPAVSAAAATDSQVAAGATAPPATVGGTTREGPPVQLSTRLPGAVVPAGSATRSSAREAALTGGAGSVSAAPSAAPAAVTVAARLEVLLDESRDDKTAARALAEAERLIPRATEQEKSLLDLVRAEALGMQNKKDRACDIARDLKSRLDGSTYARRVELLLSECS